MPRGPNADVADWRDLGRSSIGLLGIGTGNQLLVWLVRGAQRSVRLIWCALNVTPPTVRSNFSAISAAECRAAKSLSCAISAGVQRFATRYSSGALVEKPQAPAEEPGAATERGPDGGEGTAPELNPWSIRGFLRRAGLRRPG
jgi:hypothetical protein